MQTIPRVTSLDDPDYPSSDGKPMSDNTKQFRWIVAVQGGLDAVFDDDPNVLVVGNLLWYPVEGDNTIRATPDVMVILGRPKGDRGSYIQHREGGIAPQVVFEVLSPGNRAGEMRKKLATYQKYGVEEYYILDPDFARHKGYLREGATLKPIADLFGWTSPRLNVRFELTKELRILTPDGRPFEFYTEVFRRSQASDLRADEATLRAGEERRRAEEATLRAEDERRRAEVATHRAARERLLGEQAIGRAEQEKQRADEATLRAERLLAQLRALGMEPEA